MAKETYKNFGFLLTVRLAPPITVVFKVFLSKVFSAYVPRLKRSVSFDIFLFLANNILLNLFIF